MKTIKNSIDAFLFHCNYEKKLSPKTLKAYTTDCNQFLLFTEKQNAVSVNAIDKYILKQFFQHLENLKPKTLKRKIATLKSMFNFLEFEDEISINPFRKMKVNIKEPLILPSVMSLIEVEKVIKTAMRQVINITNKKTYAYFEKLRHLATIELLFATGIRVSELCYLKIEDIDLTTGTLKIMGKGSRQRVIQICHSEVLSVLRLYYSKIKRRELQKGYFFINRLGCRLSDQSIRIMIKEYTFLAGIKKKITPHTFRHSFATLLLEQNVDIKYIQSILGHSSISTTQIYTHVNNSKQREILLLQHPRKLIHSGMNKG